MPNRGYTKHWRKLWDNPVLNNPNRHAVFCYLLDHAEHGLKKCGNKWVDKSPEEMRSVFWQGARLYMRKGQVDRTLKQICDKTGCNKSSAQRSLKILEKEGMIDKRAGSKFCIYTICNYEIYQMTDKLVNKRTINERYTSEAPTKNVKNVKNEKKTCMSVEEMKTYTPDTANDLSVEKKIELLFHWFEIANGRKVVVQEKRIPKMRTLVGIFSMKEIYDSWLAMTEDDFIMGIGQHTKRVFSIDYCIKPDKVDRFLSQLPR